MYYYLQKLIFKINGYIPYYHQVNHLSLSAPRTRPYKMLKLIQQNCKILMLTMYEFPAPSYLLLRSISEGPTNWPALYC